MPDSAIGYHQHGSPAGYQAGCRSRGGCAHHGSTAVLTCAEAYIAHRGDQTVGQLPAGTPISRDPAERARLLNEQRKVHGTPFGYERGCRTRETCINYSRGIPTCVEANSAYRQQWLTRRQAGQGKPIPHGSANGYLAGCRDETQCPAPGGLTCAAALRARRRALRQSSPEFTFSTTDVQELSRAIGDAIATGLSHRELARRSGVGRTTIGRIVANGQAGNDVSISERVLAQVDAAVRGLGEASA